MRKLIQISLLMIYLCFNAGLSYSMHFCGEELARVNFFTEDKNCCPEGEEMPGCCNDVPKIDLQNAEQSLVRALDVQFDHPTVRPVHFLIADMLASLSDNEEVTSDFYKEGKAPPINTPLYIKHQLFLI